jgi:hypothetical protein
MRVLGREFTPARTGDGSFECGAMILAGKANGLWEAQIGPVSETGRTALGAMTAALRTIRKLNEERQAFLSDKAYP